MGWQNEGSSIYGGSPQRISSSHSSRLSASIQLRRARSGSRRMPRSPEISAPWSFWRSLRQAFARRFTAKAAAFLLAQVALLAMFVVISPVILRQLAKAPSGARPDDKNSDDEGLGIRSLIERVRSELDQLERKRIANNEASLLHLDTFDLEIAFVATRTASAKGGVNYEVITVDNERSVSSERIQRLNLHYKVPAREKDRSAPSPDDSSVSIKT